MPLCSSTYYVSIATTMWRPLNPWVHGGRQVGHMHMSVHYGERARPRTGRETIMVRDSFGFVGATDAVVETCACASASHSKLGCLPVFVIARRGVKQQDS